MNYNRKTLVSVFTPQEAREAILGGARIIDSEDPKSALGNIKPANIMRISDTVLNYKRNLEIQLSTNIGEDQLLFKRSQTGQAIEKSSYEIAGKAAQAALGVAVSMGTRVHPCNLVKVGLDGMKIDALGAVLTEVVTSLGKTENYSHSQVMSVLFVQDIQLYESRKNIPYVRSVLVGLREFYPVNEKTGNDTFDLVDYAVNNLKDQNGNTLYSDQSQVSLGALIRDGVLPENSPSSYIKVNNLFPHYQYFPFLSNTTTKTNREVIKAMIDVTADCGADAIMLDTSVLSKVTNICAVDTSSNGLVDINKYDTANGMVNTGILSLDDIRYFVDYCHFRGIEANLAGSIESYQAQQLWLFVPTLDQLSTRGSASIVAVEPGTTIAGANTRQYRIINRSLVRGMVPPEQGGVLNIPKHIYDAPGAHGDITDLTAQINQEREKQDFPKVKCYVIDDYGNCIKEIQ